MTSYGNDNTTYKKDQCEREGIIAAFHFSPFPCLIIEPLEKFSIINVNQAFSGLASNAAEVFIGQEVAEVLSDSALTDKEILISTMLQVFSSQLPASLKIPRSVLFSEERNVHPENFLHCEIYPVSGSNASVDLLVMQLRGLPEEQRPISRQQEHVLLKSELEAQREKYEDLFNLNPLPQFVYDLDTLDFLFVNEAAEREYGYSKKEFDSMTLMDIRPEEDKELLRDIISNKVIKGHIGNSTIRHMKRNGEIMYVNVQGTTVRYEGKNARLVVVVNLTEKMRTQKALERSERRFKALAQEGSDMIAILSPEGDYHYVNPNSKAIIGVPSEFYIGKNAFEFIHEEDKAMFAEHIGLLMKHKRLQLPPFRFEINDGEYRWIETVMTNMVDDASISGIIANSRDVTERINNDMKVQESIERFNVLSKATSDAVWDWNMKDDKLIWNKGICGIFGYKVNETEDSWWQERIHKEDVSFVLKKFHATIKNRRSRLEVEYRFRCSNGRYKNVLDRMFITYNNNGEAVRMIGSMQDITDRTNYTKEIQEQNHRLQEISWMQSHGVRAPLARVLGLTNLLSSGLIDEGSSEESLRYLLQSATELDNVVRDIIKKTEGLQKKNK